MRECLLATVVLMASMGLAWAEDTLLGPDANKNLVRDDVEAYIDARVTDSARHRQALKQFAVAIQRGLLATTKEESMEAATAETRSIECLSYLGFRTQDRWKEVLALTLNTDARLLANEAHQDRITGAVFSSLPDNQQRSECAFDAEALPD